MCVGIGHFCRDVTSCESAWIAVFIIDPDFHSQLFPFLYGIIKEMMPIFGNVFRDQSRSGMNENTSQSTIFELFHVEIDPLFGNFIVPVPQRGTAVFGGRVLQFGLQRGKIIDFATPIILFLFASGKD